MVCILGRDHSRRVGRSRRQYPRVKRISRWSENKEKLTEERLAKTQKGNKDTTVLQKFKSISRRTTNQNVKLLKRFHYISQQR